jgi:hypothetical protein
MAEHKTESPYEGKGTSQGRDQRQRAEGRGEMGGTHHKKDHECGGEGPYRGKGRGRREDGE